MKHPTLDVLLVGGDAVAQASAAGALRRRRHTVRTVASALAALDQPTADVVVVEVDLGAASAFDLLAELRRRGQRPHAILLASAPSATDWRAALRCGAADLLPRPFLLEELVGAVEACPPRPARRPQPPDTARRFHRDVQALPERADACVRELAAFLLRAGVPPSARARIAGCCAELVDNAVRHAHPEVGAARVQVSAEVREREVELVVRDGGRGFAPRVAASSGGLARASALAESFALDARPGAGTTARATFGTWCCELDDGESHDLAELDWLPPALARRVLESLRGERSEPDFHLSPALAVAIGRILAGTSERQAAERALWSRSA